MRAPGRRSRRGWSAWVPPAAALAALAAVFLWTPPAAAHTVPIGVGGVLDGATRLLLTPSDPLLVCALSVLAVQNGAAQVARLRWTLPLAWWLGGLVGLGWPLPWGSGWPTSIALLLAGLLAALQVPLGPRAITVLALAAGLVSGLVHGSAQASHAGAPAALAGGVAVLAALVTLLTLAPHLPIRSGCASDCGWRAAGSRLPAC